MGWTCVWTEQSVLPWWSGMGGVQPSPAGLSLGEPWWTLASHLPHVSLVDFPCLRWPGLEELSVRAGCDDLTMAGLKSRVHWECMPNPALPTVRLDYPEPRSSGAAPLPSALVEATSPWSLP